MPGESQSIDVEVVDKVIANAARKLHINALYEILAGAVEHSDIEGKARKYLGGPVNHTGSPLPNEKVRNVIQNCAEIICLNGPPSVHRERIRNRLVINLDLYYVSLDKAYNEEFGDPKSPYPGFMLSKTINDSRLPDKMKVELLGKYLERRILRGQTRFLVDGFPETERLAAIFEEDVCLIQTYIYVDGPRDLRTPTVEWDNFVKANRIVCGKLEAEGRFFKLDLRKPLRQVDADVTDIETTIRSIKYMARIMDAGDVFRPPPPT